MTLAPWDDRVRRRLKLRDVDVLLAVVQTGSMGKAGAVLRMSQPAVSKAIASLEQTLGVQLLDRSRRGVEPTPYGLALIKRGVAVFDELRQGVQDIAFLTDPTVGEIRVGGTEGMISTVFSPVVHQLSTQYPRMSFRVIVGDLRTLYRELEARRVDVVVSRLHSPPSEEIRPKSFMRIPWSSSRDCAIRWLAAERSRLPNCWMSRGHSSRPTPILARSPWMPFALSG